MSEVYETDQEQLDKISRWWEENGRTTVVGLVLGLGAVFGWTGWQSWQLAQAEAASSLYAQVVNAARADRPEDLRQNADTLLAEFPGSGYSVLATLHLARQAVVEKNPDEAVARLQWVLANADLEAYRHVARLRLARLSLDAGDTQAATAVLSGGGELADDAPYGADYLALRGDIARINGDTGTARDLYQRALTAVGEETPMGQRLAIKLSALGHFNIQP